MTVKRKIKSGNCISDKERDKVISRGADSYTAETNKRTKLLLRIPQSLLDEIDRMAKQVPGCSRTYMIVQMLQDQVNQRT